jgi:hypothetical protein
MNIIFVIIWIVVVDDCLDILDICKNVSDSFANCFLLDNKDSSDSDKIQKVSPGPFVRRDHRRMDAHKTAWVQILLIPEQLPFPIQILQRIRQFPLFAIHGPHPHDVA